MKLMLKTGFALALATILAVGFVTLSGPVDAQLKPAPGPSTDCPSTTCPSNTSGWVHDGYCTTNYGHGCVEQCQVLRNTSTGVRCKNTNNCAWW